MGITEEILGEIERAGWKLVPVEPTREMLVAINWPNDPAGYRAMLAAAPAAPVAQGYDALCGIEWKPQGEANEYILLRGSRWVATVRFNGELLPEAQGEILKAMLCDKTVRYGDGFHMGYWKGRADLASEQQPDTVAVPRELLERAVDRLTHGHELDKACRELRALLAGKVLSGDEMGIHYDRRMLRALLAGGAE